MRTTLILNDEVVEKAGQSAAFTNNEPRGVRCVHPLVTLLEKLDAISRRYPREDLNAASFIRHYEDATRIVRATGTLPPLEGYGSVRKLADELLDEQQLRALPIAADPAFNLPRGARTDELHRAHEAVAGMFWGARVSMADAAHEIRDWIERSLG